jgi:hypothetical protein
MKINTDHFANLYYKPKAQKSKVRALLNGTVLPHDIEQILNVAHQRWQEQDDAGAAFFILELCEAVERHLAERADF